MNRGVFLFHKDSAEQASKSKADERTQALQGLAAVANGYQAYNALSNGGALVKAEVGLGVRTASQSQTIHQSSGQNNTLTGENIRLTSTNGDIDLNNTQLKADQTIDLNSSRDIHLTAGQSQHQLDGQNKSAGVAVGAGVSVGAQTGIYIYAEANQSKGKQHQDSLSHEHTTLNSKQLNITSKGDTTLKGAVANTDRIDVNVGKTLTLTSVQDITQQDTKQSSVGGRVQVSLGTAWEVSGNYAQSKGTGSSKQVNTQTALNAGQGGFHITTGAVDLQAGAITSQADKSKNELITNKLTFSNLDNDSSYDVQSVSVNASYGSKHQQANPNDSTAFQNTKLGQYFANSAGKQGLSSTPSLPQREQDKSHSTTYATLSDSKIIIAGKQTNVDELGIHSNSATANQKVNDLPDLEQLIEKQKTISQATADINSAIDVYIANKVKQEQQEKINDNNTTLDWGVGGDKSRALKAVTTLVTGALGGQTDVQTVVNSFAPYLAKVIGNKFGHGEDQNKTAQMIGHFLLGATIAYVNGADPVTGGSSAVAGEMTADYLAKQYDDGQTALDPVTGQFNANLLPEEVKQEIKSLSSSVGALVGVMGVTTKQDKTTSHSSNALSTLTQAQVGAVVANNAVENNRLLHTDELKIINELMTNYSGEDQTDKENRLRVAACYLIKCSQGVAPSDEHYDDLIATEKLGSTYTIEIDELIKTGLFKYTVLDRADDLLARNDKTVTKIKGVTNLTVGTITTGGSIAGGVAGCIGSSGLACVGSIALAGIGIAGGVDQAKEGYHQIKNEYISTTGQTVIDSFGEGNDSSQTGELITNIVSDTISSRIKAPKISNKSDNKSSTDKSDIPHVQAQGLPTIEVTASKEWWKNADPKVSTTGKQPSTQQQNSNQNVVCSNGNVCFTAGTFIETSEGLKAIETFTGGELIWSRNDITLEYGYHPVIATKATPDQPIFQVTVKNNQGDIETLETTAEHPFWIKNTGWLKASLLEQGMILLDRNNQEVEVLSQYLLPNHTDTVYNIEVDNFHTYHVGRLGVWVHNADCCDLSPIIYNGKEAPVIGTGGNKIVYDVGGGQVLAVMQKGKKTEELQKELDKLDQLRDLGLPTVNARMTTFNNQPALLMDKYAKGSKEIVIIDSKKGKAVLVNNADTSLLNERSVRDLQAIKQKMEKDKIKIDDLQFLIGKDGSIVISDPLVIHTNTKPSTKNIGMINLLIEEARKNSK